MEINKAHWSTEGDHVRLSMPINKVDKEKRIVTGFATLDNLDRQGDVVPSEASVRAFETFRGNIREMHQPIAVGKVVSFREDKYFDEETKKFYNGIVVSAYVSKGAQDTWEKVLDGTLTGFSIGGEINETEDVYDEDLDKSYRVIKEYSLSELSLVDNPANQFANVYSIEKGVATGYLAKTPTENVFFCRDCNVVKMSADSLCDCPQCDCKMTNIGFVESNDAEKASVVKDMLKGFRRDEIQKGIQEMSFVKYDDSYGRVEQIVLHGGAKLSSEDAAVMAKSNDPVAILKVYSQIDGTIVPTNRRVIKNISSLEKVNAISKSEVKEVSKMDSDIVIVDEIEKGLDFEGSGDDQINPGPTELPVEEVTTEGAETIKAEMPEVEKAIEIEVTEEDDMNEEVDKGMTDCKECGMSCSPSDMKNGMCEKCYGMTAKADMPAVVSEEDVNATTKMISDIADSLTSTLSTLAETVKALDAKIEGITKSVAGISTEVEEVKDKFGKRVDAVEKDTAFRKSADLGEILQEQPMVTQKSLWGGSFLKNADLFR